MLRQNQTGLGRNRTPLSQRLRRARHVERLEPRNLLAADVIISEVLASNDNVVQDDDGARSDYIELYNRGHEPVDLNGWHLTDRLEDRTQWTFPEVQLAPGESLVVFASGNDRTDPNAVLHTNFRISRRGEYLALYEPDGRTVAFEFNELPEQYTDVSYGVGQTLSDRTFIADGSEASVLILDRAAADVQGWASPDFDDSAWVKRTTGLGFDDDASDGDFGPLLNENGGLDMRGKGSSVYVRTEFNIDSEFLPTYESLQLDINFDDGFVGYLNGEEVVNINAPETLAWNSTATQSNGGIADHLDYVDFTSDGFTTLGDATIADGIIQVTPSAADKNGAVWRTEPVNFGSDFTFSAAMVFDVHTPGGTLADGDGDGIGGEGMTFVLQSNDNNVLGTGGRSLGLENTGSTFLAIELDSGADGAFDPDTTLPSHIGVNTNNGGNLGRAEIRRFNGNAIFPGDPGPGNLQYLWLNYAGETKQLDVYYSTTETKPEAPTLSVTVDLNEHFSDSPSLYAGWTATTTASFNAHDVRSFNILTGVGEIGRDPITVDLREHIGKLKAGKNVLAFHGLNVDANDKDFLLVPNLSAKEVSIAENVGFFIEPTPGTLNGVESDPPGSGVTISEPTKLFVDTFTVEITAVADNAVIRYTTDGTLPSEESEIYTGPITISESTRIRARAFEPNRSPGPSSTSGFTKVSPQLMSFENGNPFQSNVPIVIIDSFGNRRVDSESVLLVPSTGIFIAPGEDGRTNLFDEPDFAGRVGARTRGQSSQGWAKKQYALEFMAGDTDDSDRIASSESKDLAVSFFGLPAESDWVLNGPYADKSQLNNYLTFNWSRAMGQYAPRNVIVEVFVNGDGRNEEEAMLDFENDYRGTYVLTEKIKVDANRVDINKLVPGDNTGEAITGGYIWKKDKTGAEDLNFNTGVNNQEVRIVEPSCSDSARDRDTRLFTCVSGEISDAQIAWLTNHVTEFEEALYGPNFTDPAEGYANFIDVDSWVDTWLTVEFTKNIDGFRLSTYYHKDLGGKIKQGPVWDYNLSLGNANYLQGGNPEGWYGDLIGAADYPYWDRLFEDPAFEQAVVDRWHELRETIWSTENLLKDINNAVNIISDNNPNLDRPAEGEASNPISRNYQRWTTAGYGTDKYHWPNCYFRGNNGDCPSVSPLPGGREPETYGDHIFLMSRFVELRAEWIDEQFAPEIFVSPEPGILDSPTQVTVTGPEGAQIFYTTDGHDPQQPLFIRNEFNLIGPNVMVDYHVPTGPEMIDLCNGRDLASPDKCFINTNYELGANGETWKSGPLGIGYDADADFGPFVSTDIEGDLKGVNSSIYVRIPFDVTQEMKDDFGFLSLDVQYSDGFIAYLWRADDSGREVARANVSGSASRLGIRARGFDEIAEDPRDDASGLMFETFNISAEDDHLHVGRNYLVVQAVNDAADGDDFLFDLRLNLGTVREEPWPTLQEYTGPITIDKNTQLFARALDGRNWTRALVGDYFLELPELSITELNYNPPRATAAELEAMPNVDSEDFEFVEIKNTGRSTASLVGVEFEDGISFGAGSVELAPGEYGVVVSNREAFELRYGTEINVLGEFGGNLDDAGESIKMSIPGIKDMVSITYGDRDPWSEAVDGRGASLELVNELTPGSLFNKYYNWRSSTEYGGSPGAAGVGSMGIVINEVVSRTDPTITTDAVELLNVTGAPINVGGWHLSDSSANFLKYRIADGTTIGAGEALIITEQQFNSNPEDPNAFAFNGSDGDEVWLTVTDGNGNVSAIVDNVRFGGSLTGESFSRYPNGAGRLAPAPATIGQQNAYPRVGPVVISEVQYNPSAPSEAAIAAFADIAPGDLEFVEIHNPTDAEVDLTDWRIRGGIDMNFSLGEMLAAGETVVITSFNPDGDLNVARTAAFRAQYGIDTNVRLIGGYAGQLSGNGERITLLSRDLSVADQPIVLPLVTQDEVVYDNTGRWSSDADGTGNTLHRMGVNQYGNLAFSWEAAAATPGRTSFVQSVAGDVDADGLVEASDVDMICSAVRAGDQNMQLDLNGDGIVSHDDQTFLIQNILNTAAGDANLDGVFDSRDLIAVIGNGEYEDTIAGNSTWSEGDWNCDGDFTTRDLVSAFLADSYLAASVADESVQLDVGAVGSALDDSVIVVDSDKSNSSELATKSELQKSRNLLLQPTQTRSLPARDRFFAETEESSDELDDDLLTALIV